MSWWRSTKEQIARRSIVTDEPFVVDPTLLGRTLATPRRRAVAIAIDCLLWFVIGVVVLLTAAVFALRIQAPAAYDALRALTMSEITNEASWDRAQLDIYALIHRRRPDLLPRSIAVAVESNDAARLDGALEAEPLSIIHALSSDPSHYNAATRTLRISNDVTFGAFDSGLNFLVIALLYFTVTTRLTNGRTPGKWLLRIRARRLDGRRFDWGAAFGRAGGYASSAATFGLGFLAAVRDPNRQALHDRIAGTVVVIEGYSRRTRLRRRSRQGILRLRKRRR